MSVATDTLSARLAFALTWSDEPDSSIHGIASRERDDLRGYLRMLAWLLRRDWPRGERIAHRGLCWTMTGKGLESTPIPD